MGVPYFMVTSEDEFSRLRKILKGETSFYFNVIKFYLLFGQYWAIIHNMLQ